MCALGEKYYEKMLYMKNFSDQISHICNVEKNKKGVLYERFRKY